MAEPSPVNDDHLKRLAEAILSSLEGPAPTPPLAPDPVGLSPLHAAAGAMNPQFAPLLLQRANQPGQNAYNQQLMAFEQAMQGRRDALTAGTSLLNANTRADAYLKRPSANVRMQEKSYDITGKTAMEFGLDPNKKWTIRQSYNPIDGSYTAPEVVGEAFVAPFIQPAIPGVSGPNRIPRTGPAGEIGNVPPAPPSTSKDFREDKAFMDMLSVVEGEGNKIADVAKDDGLWSFVLNKVGETQYGGAIAASRPYYEYVNTVKSALNAYILANTGLSFPEQAFARYYSEFPKPWDSPDTRAKLLANLSRRMLSDMASMRQQYPNVEGGPRNPTDWRSLVEPD